MFCPHTTAGMTMNETPTRGAPRPAMALERLVPADLPFAHLEGNSDAHVKASIMGSSVTVPVENGHLALGTWQGIYFAEFDGPRRRRLLVQPLRHRARLAGRTARPGAMPGPPPRARRAI